MSARAFGALASFSVEKRHALQPRLKRIPAPIARGVPGHLAGYGQPIPIPSDAAFYLAQVAWTVGLRPHRPGGLGSRLFPGNGCRKISPNNLALIALAVGMVRFRWRR
jgi:hypothetical protein